jgi:hypothetical protein
LKIEESALREDVTAGLSNKEIADKYGVSLRAVQYRLKRLAERGFSPKHDMVHEVPAPFLLKGTSTLYKDGKSVLQWVKTKLDPEREAELIREFIDGISSDLPRADPVPAPPLSMRQERHLNLFPITDYHLGMLAWGEESGDDWDIKIAEALVIKWLSRAISDAPQAGTAVLANIGDFLHWDGLAAVTPQSRHVLDADSRYTKLVRVAVRIIRKMIEMLLETHDKVHVIMAEGNHDEASSVWLRETLPLIYENEPRITFDQSSDPYYCYEFGKVALTFHHGHKANFKRLESTLLGKFRAVFGRTEYFYCHTGHLHHLKMDETGTMVLEQHRTLSAKDAYASRGGWLSQRSASVITYDSEFGEVRRATITPAMLQ